MVGLTYLGHAFGLSDEEVVRRWVENPYWQFFCGEEYFRHDLPIDPSSLSRWRKRIGEEGSELILKITLHAGLQSGAVRESSLERITVDTTVQPKAVAFPTDSRLYNRSRERLVKLAADNGIPLRQSYSRLGSYSLLKAGRYLHARQGKRARREIKKLRTFLGRVYRDILRKIEDRRELKPVFQPELSLAARLLSQAKKDKNKLYSLHAPEVECIAKGKAHKKYEFGVKVSIAATNRDNFVVGMFAEHGNPYDGHTLSRAFEPVIGHMKADGKLGRNHLLGELGDKINALLCGAGHNIRLILRKLREFLFFVVLVRWLEKFLRPASWHAEGSILPVRG